MELTRRGWGAIAIIVVSIAMGRWGSRSLNAVVAPLVVALVAARYQLRRVERPTLDREVPAEGHVGDRREVGLEFDVDGPLVGRIYESVGQGLAATGNEIATTVDGSGVSYTVELRGRGPQDLGPTTFAVEDTLGLTRKTFTYDDTDELLVYPPVYDLTGGAKHDLDRLAREALQHNREEFDSLREYVRGDSLRDIHWKSSAKRTEDDLVVKEFVAEETLGSITVVAEASEDGADEMAAATASVAMYLLDIGVETGVAAPDGSVSPGTGTEHRQAILRLLARTGPGVATATEAGTGTIVVEGHDGGATVSFHSREVSFAALAGARMDTLETVTPTTAARQREVVPA